MCLVGQIEDWEENFTCEEGGGRIKSQQQEAWVDLKRMEPKQRCQATGKEWKSLSLSQLVEARWLSSKAASHLEACCYVLLKEKNWKSLDCIKV